MSSVKLKQELETYEKDAFHDRFIKNPQDYIFDDDIDFENLTPAELEEMYQDWNERKKRYIKFKIVKMEEFELLLYPRREPNPAPEPTVANIWR